MPNPLLHQLNVLGSVVASSVGLWRGTAVVTEATAPAKPLKLYEFEGCPYCRAVREVFTALHLDAEVYPCPKGGTRFRPEAEKLGGKQQFPLLIDPNNNTVMYESVDIIRYVFETYAELDVPAFYKPGFFKEGLAGLATTVRGGAGIFYRRAKVPAKSLKLWSFESSPYSRPVRERLSEFEIPYLLYNVGKERWQDIGPAVLRLKPGAYEPMPGGKREQHFTRTGHMQVPYLEDPNTGEHVLGSAKILDYLESTYAI
jgi:glutathione S-transferase